MDLRSNLAEAVRRLPLGPLRDALSGVDAYLVGGWVRELVAGRDPGGDLDIAVDGGLEDLLDRLEGSLEIEVHERHRRFGAATVGLGELRVDLTSTRRERYGSPGALPEVEPAPIGEDLRRRDFTINSMAVALASPEQLLDPFDGARDVREGVLRVLYAGSFVDDPTRAIRAARYAARFGLEPAAETLALLRSADLSTVSADRRDAELARLAAEPAAREGFRLLAEWRLLELASGGVELIDAVDGAASREPWSGEPSLRSRAILIAAAGGERLEAALRLARAQPERPSEAMRLAAGHQPAELLLAAAAGSEWVGDYVERWSRISLEISGEDLLAAGIPEGPAVGAGLRGALERKLDGGLSGGPEAELEVAVALARQAI